MRKGFTLVELLGVIVIMGVIALIAVPAVDSVVRKGKEKAYDITKSTIITATKNWLLDNKSLLDDGETVNVTLADLKEQGYLEFDIKNPSSGNCLDNTMEVSISRNGKKYTYAITGDELVDSSDSNCEATGRAPSIYLLGSNPVNVEINTPFVDLGAKATDTEGNDISYKIIKPDVINTSVLATNLSYKYTILSDGITKTISRKVNVIDTTKPVITGAADTTITTSDTTFNIMNGVSATDNSGETIVVKTKSNLTLGVEGEYKITYIATDSSGNTSTVTRNIRIQRGTSILRTYTSGQYFWSDTYRSSIEEINFVNYINTTGASITWDLSSTQDNSIVGWLITDVDNPSYYKLYIGSKNNIYANPNSQRWFYNLNNVYSIKFYNYNTSIVEDMYRMFYNTTSLVNLDLTVFDTSNVTNMDYMFYHSENLTSIDIKKFDTSKVTTMASMFSHMYSLYRLDLSNFNTSNVTDMSYLFSSMYDLIYLDISSFDTQKTTDMSGMFYQAENLKNLDLSNFDTSNVTDMSSMFIYCYGLIDLDLSNFNTSNVTDMSYMFSSNDILTNLDLSNFNTSNVTNMNHMFYYATGILNLNLHNFNTTKVTDMSYMFSHMESLTNLDISSFNTANVTDMSYLFSSCSNLTSLNLSNFNTSNVTNMNYMFHTTNSLTSLNLSNFNTSKVTSMNSMFRYAEDLTNLNVSSFDTSNVTDMGSMFFHAISISTIDISNFNTSKVTNMNSMFSYANNLATIYVGTNWTTALATTTDMFLGCGTSTVTPK